ncbi:ABC transporter ATP-binding protein [Streptomyces sp. NPDC087901]|uniref:ABC transporter ATP-binding protein n=1 Tax=unclassified Streptomyces TaxID=2593676 RepID=UPI003420B7F8
MSRTPDEMAPLPPSLTSLGRSLRLGYRAGPALILVAFVTTVAAAAPDALFAVGFALLIHAVIDQDSAQIMTAAVALGALATGSWLLNTVTDRANRRFADRAAVYVESYVARLQSSIVTLEHHERPSYLDRLSLLRDHAGALSQLYQQLFSTVGAAVRLVVTLAVLMSVHPALGLLGLVAVPGVAVSHWRSGVDKAVEESGAQHDRRARHLFTLATQAGAGKEIRVAGVQGWLREQWRDSWLRRYAPLSEARWRSALWQSASQLLFGAAFIAAIAQVAHGRGPAATDTLLLLTAGSRLSQYIGQTVTQTQFFRAIWLDASRKLAWLENLAAAERSRADLQVPDRLEHGIRLENVSFRYPGGDTYALRDVNLHLPAGKVVAIVGANGAGKSSLVKLLCKLYEPTSGHITVDGADLGRLPPDGWRARVTGAFQDFFRFEYSVVESVGLGDLARIDNRSAVEGAIARAGADGTVSGLEHGVDTQLGPTWEGGVGLSHGQWQRIALARGFMRDKPLLMVLDEPTSALDAETEHALFERYATAARGQGADVASQITVLISHRFSTVGMADLIVVIDGARVVEHGSHAQLMARKGLYADLYGLQAASYRDGAKI